MAPNILCHICRAVSLFFPQLHRPQKKIVQRRLVRFEKSCPMFMFALQSGVNAGFVYGDSTALWDKHWRGQLVFYLGSGVTSEANLLIIPTYCGMAHVSDSSKHTKRASFRWKCVWGAHLVCFDTSRQSIPATRLEQSEAKSQKCWICGSRLLGTSWFIVQIHLFKSTQPELSIICNSFGS